MSKKKWSFTVDESAVSLKRVDKIIFDSFQRDLGNWNFKKLDTLSRTWIQKLIQEGCVFRNGTLLTDKEKTKLGEEISIFFPEAKKLDLVPKNIPLDILYEDDHLLLINKPAGLVVHPSSTSSEDTLVHALLYHCKNLSSIGGVERPGIVHRLDKDTSGVMVITKTDLAHITLSKEFSKRKLDRRYLALCHHTKKETILPLKTFFGRHPVHRKRMAVLQNAEKNAETHFFKKEDFSIEKKTVQCSLWEAKLFTGRTHQVRVHAQHLGIPLLADPVYGKNQKFLDPVAEKIAKLPGQALHAKSITFIHPVSQKTIHQEAPLPSAFQDLLFELRKYTSQKF